MPLRNAMQNCCDYHVYGHLLALPAIFKVQRSVEIIFTPALGGYGHSAGHLIECAVFFPIPNAPCHFPERGLSLFSVIKVNIFLFF